MKQISGLLDGLIKKIAPFFLYIFIPSDANLGSKIMGKRKKQIDLLAAIEKVDITRNMDKYISLIRAGIVEKYKLQPEQVLSVMYVAVNRPSVNGIGNPGDSYFDGCDWVDETTGAALPPEQQMACTELAEDIEADSTPGRTSTFISDFKEIVDWIVELLNTLGITKPRTDLYNGTPNTLDWKNDSINEAGLSGSLPYVIGAGLIYYLYSKTKK